MAINSPTEVVSWLREQAATLNQMADRIEGLFPKIAAFGHARVAGRAQVESVEVPTVSKVKEAIAGRKMRINSLAEEMRVEPRELARIMTAENGFVRGERGWFSVKKGGDE